jgi:hypothetical protein
MLKGGAGADRQQKKDGKERMDALSPAWQGPGSVDLGCDHDRIG